jgi:glycosyltransferase involved in cell wall biosynthesis
MHDFLIPRSKITVIHNATDTARFRPQPENKQLIREELFGPMVQSTDVVIALAANLRPAKRQWMLVRALDELRGSHPDAKAVIAGDGPDREGIVELVADLEIGDRVIVLAGENDVAAIYAASDIAVLPSTGEGLPGSGIEALACGLPLVATPNGGTPEVFVEGENGISVRDQSPSGLARALVPLIESSSMRAKMGHSARRRAESYFAITRPANETLALYDRLRTL